MTTVTTTPTKPKKTRKKSNLVENPNLNDPRREKFSAYYLDPASPTFRNALQSALKAGFSKSYALNITSLEPDWVYEVIGKVRKYDYLKQVHKNIKEFLEMDTKEPVISMFGPVVNAETGEVLMKDNTKKMEIKSKVTMFVTEAIDADFHKKEAVPVQNNIQVNLYNLDDAEKIKLAKLITPHESRSPGQSN